MSNTPLTTEERLYSLSKQKLWDHVYEEQHRHMLESEEYDLWLVATESCREEIVKLQEIGRSLCDKVDLLADENRTLHTRVAELEKDKEALKNSLAFYASEASWLDHGFPNGDYLSLAIVDKGEHARTTLSPKPNEIQRTQG